MQTNTIHTRYNTNTIQYSICSISLLLSLLLNERLNVENETYIRIAEKGESAVKANDLQEGERSPIRRNVKRRRFKGMQSVAGKSNGRREVEWSPVQRNAKGRREVEWSPIQRKAKGRRFKGMRSVTEKSNGHRFEGRRRVTGLKECEASPGSRMVAGSKECEGSPLSLIGNGWLLTTLHQRRFELHRRRFELHRRRLSSTATVGAQSRR